MAKKNAKKKKLETAETTDSRFDLGSLYFIPMGGSEQFGVNFNLYTLDGRWLAVDLGLGFADQRLPGIEIIFPDPSFLEERSEQLEALIITHAHEDHVGAVAWLWPRLRCPVYCSPFTAQVLRRKAEEVPDSRDMDIRVVSVGDSIECGPFKVNFIGVAHSIPDTCALAIETAQGTVLHSGDWNLDPTPVAGAPTDEAAFRQFGKNGILAYIGDSTNAMVEGRAGSESVVARGLERVFRECGGRIAVTTFSSNIGRIQSICRAAEACGRSVVVVGRSLHNMVAAARDCGYLSDIRDFITEDDMDDIPADQLVMIVTGCQGEARAALSKIARGEMNGISLTRGDTVVFSSRAIPGNEKEIDAVKNNLVAAGVRVVSPGDTEDTIHVSGHPCRGEIADMLGWLRPDLVIPVHGERMQLEAQADLARRCQVGQVIVPSNGSVIHLKKGGSKIVDHVATGLLALDAGKLINADHPSIAERRKLQYTGVIHVSVVIDKRGQLAAPPRVTTMGLIDPENDAELEFEADLEQEVQGILNDMERGDLKDDHAVHEEIRIGVRRVAQMVLGLKPKASVHVIRI